MKEEYDFSKGERGKFFSEDANLNFPIYLEKKTFLFIEKIAKKKNLDVSVVVNDLLKNDMEIVKYTE